MIRLLMPLLLLLALPMIAHAKSTGQGKRVALVIGNGAYERAEDRLPNPPNDANAIPEKLDALGFDVTKTLDLDYRGMRTGLRDFDRTLESADAGLFFYAGHGMEYQGRNHLFPMDAVLESEGDISIGLIDVGQILHIMETSVPTRLIFLDACRNNPLARRFSRSLERDPLATDRQWSCPYRHGGRHVHRLCDGVRTARRRRNRREQPVQRRHAATSRRARAGR